MEAAIITAAIPTAEAIQEAAITEIPMYSEHRAVQAAPSPIFWDQCSDKFFTICSSRAQPLTGRLFYSRAMEFVPGEICKIPLDLLTKMRYNSICGKFEYFARKIFSVKVFL